MYIGRVLPSLGCDRCDLFFAFHRRPSLSYSRFGASGLALCLTRYNLRMNDAPPKLEDPLGTRQQPQEPGERNWLPWIVAAIAIAVVVGLVVYFGGNGGAKTTTASIDPYAARLSFSNIHLSQASNFAGDQLTYVDGTVTNHGNRTVTALRVQVQFANDDGQPPQSQEVPLSLIRTREPYVDTEPVSAAPLKPGTSQDFRLIFDSVSPEWNQQNPAIKVASLATRP